MITVSMNKISGAITVETRVNNVLYKQTYFGYTKNRCLDLFENYLNKLKIK